MFWFSAPVGRSRTTVPIGVPPFLPSFQTVWTAMTRSLVSSVVGSPRSSASLTSCFHAVARHALGHHDVAVLVEHEQFVVLAGGRQQRGGQRRGRGVVAEPFLREDGQRPRGARPRR